MYINCVLMRCKLDPKLYYISQPGYRCNILRYIVDDRIAVLPEYLQNYHSPLGKIMFIVISSNACGEKR